MKTPEQKPGIIPRVTPSEVPMETEGENKPRRPSRVAQSKVNMVTQEEINHMAPTIPIATPNTATIIENKPLPWYLFDAVIDTETE